MQTFITQYGILAKHSNNNFDRKEKVGLKSIVRVALSGLKPLMGSCEVPSRSLSEVMTIKTNTRWVEPYPFLMQKDMWCKSNLTKRMVF